MPVNLFHKHYEKIMKILMCLRDVEFETLNLNTYTDFNYFSGVTLKCEDRERDVRYLIHSIQIHQDCAFRDNEFHKYVTLKPLTETTQHFKVLVCIYYTEGSFRIYSVSYTTFSLCQEKCFY